MSQIHTDPATGRRYEVGADGQSRWLDPAPVQQPQAFVQHVQPQYVVPTAFVVTQRTSGMSTAALVLGILGLFSCGFTSILAVIFGHIAEGQTRDGKIGGRGQAIAGLVLGYLAFLPFVIFWVMVMIGAATAPFTGTTPTPTFTS